MLGVKTIGNATLLAFDDAPILVTDPWMGDMDPAYFGSWILSHEIPVQEREEIFQAPYVWFSHGHPDHLNPDSVQRFRGRKILVADHVGSRIARDLAAGGFEVEVLPERRWVELSPRIRVMSIADYVQDSVLLVDVAGTLFVNLNDCRANGSVRFIRRIVSGYKRSYVLRLTGHGDADMNNFFDEDGNRIPCLNNSVPAGAQLSDLARNFGTTHVTPFSSFHQYQRADSIWANRNTTQITDYRDGFDERVAEYVEPFAAIDAETGAVTPLSPDVIPMRVRPTEDFGDCWSDELEKSDEKTVTRYFQRKEGLQKRFGFIRLVVGKRTLPISLTGPDHKGITFEVPRGSLMQAIEFEIFDDLLIGNFMRTTLHHVRSLYDPDFTYTVAKFADNAGVETNKALRTYMAEYRRRAGLELSVSLIADDLANVVEHFVGADTWLYRTAKSLYYRLHG